MIIMKKLTLLLVLMCGFSGSVLADQAMYVDRATADKAVAILKKQKEIKHFCKPCDDVRAKEEVVYSAKTFSANNTSNDYIVYVNDKEIDLAYVYYKKGLFNWVNLAMDAGFDQVSDVDYKLKE